VVAVGEAQWCVERAPSEWGRSFVVRASATARSFLGLAGLRVQLTSREPLGRRLSTAVIRSAVQTDDLLLTFSFVLDDAVLTV
jgi:hypothetical protein